MPTVDPPLALLAELTHRCPLSCPYCSNPVELERAASELSEEEWDAMIDINLKGAWMVARRIIPIRNVAVFFPAR